MFLIVCPSGSIRLSVLWKNQRWMLSMALMVREPQSPSTLPGSTGNAHPPVNLLWKRDCDFFEEGLDDTHVVALVLDIHLVGDASLRIANRPAYRLHAQIWARKVHEDTHDALLPIRVIRGNRPPTRVGPCISTARTLPQLRFGLAVFL